MQFLKLGLVEKFHRCLVHGPRPRYHASRALVYLGKLEMLKNISLFAPVATGEWNGTWNMYCSSYPIPIPHSPFQVMRLMS